MQQVQARIRLLVLYLLVSLPILIYGAVRALEASNNSPIDWVDGRFSERRVYDHFSEQFGPGDAVVIMDADLQHPPEMIEKFLELWREGYDVVYGQRIDRHTDSWARRAFTAVFYHLFASFGEIGRAHV